MRKPSKSFLGFPWKSITLLFIFRGISRIHPKTEHTQKHDIAISEMLLNMTETQL